MNRCTNSFPLPRSLTRLTLLIAAIVLPAIGAYSQTQPSAEPYQKAAVITARPCPVESSGEVTYLVKNGVELSVNEDWDCDGHADAYDNCVGMPNATQADSDGNGIGDVCEAATIVKAGVEAKTGSNARAKAPKELAKGRSNAKAKTSKKKELAKSRANTKSKPRQAKAADRRSRSGGKRPRNG
jgi:hypothetical protein